jgi:hypothetical protein
MDWLNEMVFQLAMDLQHARNQQWNNIRISLFDEWDGVESRNNKTPFCNKLATTTKTPTSILPHQRSSGTLCINIICYMEKNNCECHWEVLADQRLARTRRAMFPRFSCCFSQRASSADLANKSRSIVWLLLSLTEQRWKERQFRRGIFDRVAPPSGPVIASSCVV